MNIREAIKYAMKSKGLSQNWMAEQLSKINGKSITANYVSARLSQKNWTFNSAIEYLDLVGYEVIVRPKTSGKRGDSEIKIDIE